MAFITREMQGSLFPANKTKDSQPEYSGNCVIGGVAYWIAGWRHTSKGGDVYLSLSFTPKEGREEADAKKPSSKGGKGSGDDIPF